MGALDKGYSKPNVYGSGLISLDLVMNSNPDSPIYSWAGGTCGNVLAILGYLGWSAYPVARLNGDSASVRVKSDLLRWGVNLDFAEQEPKAATPIITQQITKDREGNVKHKFSMNCPKCGAWFPHFKSVTLKPAKDVAEKMFNPQVFFFDRVSPGALLLAEKCKELGGVVFFEPSAKSDEKNLVKALELADIIKYASDRFRDLISKYKIKKEYYIEIQTEGHLGLVYKASLKNFEIKSWKRINPYRVEKIKDSCGSGDWTTSGIIEKLCSRGISGLFDKSLEELEAGFAYGQALGAWNCQFEGARGGMYLVNRDVFTSEIKSIMQGERIPHPKDVCITDGVLRDVVCPSCV